MSKAKLKKELDGFSREQLIEVILATYDSSKGAKDYLEFFLNPDADSLLDKTVDAVAKELKRIKRGVCKGRISVIRRTLKEFEAFGVGVEYHARMVYYTFRMLLGQSGVYYFPEALHAGIAEMARNYVLIAARNGFLEEALENVRNTKKELGRKYVNRQIDEAIEVGLKELNINTEI